MGKVTNGSESGMKKCRICQVVLTPLNTHNSNWPPSEFICVDDHKKISAAKYQSVKEERVIQARQTRKDLKQQIIDHYGGKCECCDIDNFEFLSVEHKDGGGTKHKQELGIKGGTAFYQWIVKHDFPDNLGLLCFSCNYADGVFGYCPHQQKSIILVEQTNKFNNYHKQDKVCINCGINLTKDNRCKTDVDINKSTTYLCHECHNYRRKYKRMQIKLEIIQEYGGKCVCCQEDHWEFLTIDHINGGGRKHRKEVGTSEKFYSWLINQGCPKDEYRLLCMNCNCAFGFYHHCPHQQTNLNNPNILTYLGNIK